MGHFDQNGLTQAWSDMKRLLDSYMGHKQSKRL